MFQGSPAKLQEAKPELVCRINTAVAAGHASELVAATK